MENAENAKSQNVLVEAVAKVAALRGTPLRPTVTNTSLSHALSSHLPLSMLRRHCLPFCHLSPDFLPNFLKQVAKAVGTGRRPARPRAAPPESSPSSLASEGYLKRGLSSLFLSFFNPLSEFFSLDSRSRSLALSMSAQHFGPRGAAPDRCSYAGRCWPRDTPFSAQQELKDVARCRKMLQELAQ